jgi:hypothetical protein
MRHSPPLDEALTRDPASRLPTGDADYRTEISWVFRATAWRKRSQAMTGEALRRPTVGKPNL